MLEREELEGAMARLIRRVNDTAQRVGGLFPYYADQESGEWSCTEDGSWVGGYWAGLLWLSYSITGEPSYSQLAYEVVKRLEPRIEEDNFYRGFLFYPGAVLGWLLTGREELRSMALKAAEGMLASYNPRAHLFPLGEDSSEVVKGKGESNIDTLICLPLLWWASKELGEDAYRERATQHALNILKHCVREDGSILQSISFDPEGGRLIGAYTTKGYSEATTWARGQAWAVQGYALAYLWTGRMDFLKACEKVAAYFLRRLPEDGVPYYDFDDPRIPEVEKDTSASAIVASALSKLSRALGEEGGRGRRYGEEALRLLTSLVRSYLSPQGILRRGCFNKKRGIAIENELIWGDYYLLEALYLSSGRGALPELVMGGWMSGRMGKGE